jgi:hypothetical protein
MPKNGYGSVYLTKHVSNKIVFTHELGHNLGLNHPFEEFTIPNSSTQNFMDYNNIRNKYWFWQWDFIRTQQTNMKIDNTPKNETPNEN